MILILSIYFYLENWIKNSLKNILIVVFLENDIKNRHDKWFQKYEDNGKEFIKDIICKNIVPEFIFACDNDCIKGFLSGYFRNCIYNNGNINIKCTC